MRIIKWNNRKEKGIMVTLSRREALRIIESLSRQMFDNHPNANRAEHFAEDGTYFSVAVEPEKEKPE